MKRTPFRRRLRQDGPTAPREVKPWAEALSASTARPLHRGTYAGSTSGAPIAKEDAIEHEGYRRLVAALPCKACGIAGISQAAHPNTGKGAGIKTDDRECFPLCCDQPGRRGCHPQFDQGAMFDKPTRRALEPVWGADTRRQITAAGQWPANLPKYEEA